MTILLITGSRAATPVMLDYARRVVSRAADLGWSIIVGDAEGIDNVVMEECQRLGVSFTCYGITARPRHGGKKGFVPYKQVQGNYLERDRVMVDQADRALAIWNGKSRGTKYTYDYAVKNGKATDIDLRTFEALHA